VPLYQQKGNSFFIDFNPVTQTFSTKLASDYDLLNITAQLTYDYWFPVHIVFVGDYVKNLGFDRQQVAGLTGDADVEEETDGYQFGLTVGYPTVREFGDWNTFLFYKYLEKDATLDAFTDSDFHLGGTNAKGWILGGEFCVYRNVWFRGRWLTSNEISGGPLSIDVFQLDLSARF
jgi:hypothetical protein